MSKAQEQAKQLLDAAKRNRFRVTVRGSVLTITRQNKPNDNEDFIAADMTYGDVFRHLPTTSAGSEWGTDGGGIGGAVALKSGVFTMNKSGGSKRVLAAITKLQKEAA